jgi:hypothetical protein
MKVSEVRLSLLEADENGTHTKHVAVTITDPALCAAIVRMVGGRMDLDKVPDAHQETIEAKKEETAANKKDAAA